MKALKSYITGIKEAILQPKMIITLWLFNFLFASLVYFPFSGLIKDFIGSSAVSEQLLSKWDNHIFFEWMTVKASALQPVLFLILIITVLYTAVSLFLKGGILSIFIVRAGVREKLPGRWLSQFFHGGGKFWWRFFRLCIYSLIFWAVFLIIMFFLSAAGRLISAGGIQEQAAFIWFWIEAVIGLFLLFLIWMILDYARIRIVAEDTGKVFISLWKGAGFVFSRFGRTLALYYLLVITGTAFFIIYWKAAGLIKTQTAAGIWLAFGIGQVFIASREWLRMAFQAGQMDLYLKAQKEPKKPPVKQKAAVREEPEEEEFDFEKPSEETWEMPLDDTEEKHE
jgi:hypothetical protein